MKPSKRQQDIFDNWAQEDNNIVINAVAGSGKTTTLMQLLERSNTKTLFVAFNKSIQTEIEERIQNKRMQSYAKAMTMHSLGLSAIKRAYKFTLVSSKGFKLMKKTEKDFEELYWTLDWKDKSYISQTILALNDVSRMFLTDDIDELRGHISDMCMSFSPDENIPDIWKAFLKHREASYNKPNIDIDFADMIYLPIIKNLRIPVTPKHLMIDEAQDLNLAQHKIIQKVLDQGTVEKWIAVGDPHQSIYGFSGAYSKSFDMFKSHPNTVEFPLDICYRCPTSIIDAANDVYSIMQPFKTEEGILEKRTFDDLETIKDGSLVICRNTQPLVNLFIEFLKIDRKVTIKGEDVLGELKKFLFPYMKHDLDQAAEEMWEREEKLKWIADNSKNPLDVFKYTSHQENLRLYIKVARFLRGKVNTVSKAISYLEHIVKDKSKEGVILSTIHKSKGLEADVVYILDEQIIPAKAAITPEMEQQEYNLKYVARTRSKRELYFLTEEPSNYEIFTNTEQAETVQDRKKF